MNDRKLLEFIATQVGTLTEKVGGMESNINNLQNDMREVKSDVKSLNNQVTIIEQDHGNKLDVLLDWYKQNAEKLDRVEKEVSTHEEVIFRKIR